MVLLADVRSVGVQGDGRTYGHPVVLRPVSSEDAMTADWTRVPFDVLATISTRITNEVREVNRVVLDITSKPPGHDRMGMIPLDPDKVRWNEKLDHLQARRPFTYNLISGVLIGVVLLIVGFPGPVVVAYILSWAAVRGFLWRDGGILRRQYEARQIRVAAEKQAQRRER